MIKRIALIGLLAAFSCTMPCARAQEPPSTEDLIAQTQAQLKARENARDNIIARLKALQAAAAAGDTSATQSGPDLPEDLKLTKDVEEIPCLIPAVPADSTQALSSCEISTRQEKGQYYVSVAPETKFRALWLDFHIWLFFNGKWEDSGVGIFQPGTPTRLDLLSLNLGKATTFKVVVFLGGRSSQPVNAVVLIFPPKS